MTPEKYTKQLRIVLSQYRPNMEDVGELYWAKSRIIEKSKDNIYKEINLREIKNKLAEFGYE